MMDGENLSTHRVLNTSERWTKQIRSQKQNQQPVRRDRVASLRTPSSFQLPDLNTCYSLGLAKCIPHPSVAGPIVSHHVTGFLQQITKISRNPWSTTKSLPQPLHSRGKSTWNEELTSKHFNGEKKVWKLRSILADNYILYNNISL